MALFTFRRKEDAPATGALEGFLPTLNVELIVLLVGVLEHVERVGDRVALQRLLLEELEAQHFAAVDVLLQRRAELREHVLSVARDPAELGEPLHARGEWIGQDRLGGRIAGNQFAHGQVSHALLLESHCSVRFQASPALLTNRPGTGGWGGWAIRRSRQPERPALPELACLRSRDAAPHA